jgi:hypothetical protein
VCLQSSCILLETYGLEELELAERSVANGIVALEVAARLRKTSRRGDERPDRKASATGRPGARGVVLAFR